MSILKTVVRAAPALLLLAGAANANILDLTAPHSQGTIGGAIFQTVDLAPTGSGVFDSFVRIQRTGTEQGYNTSGRPVAFNENTSPTFTHNLTVGDIPVVSYQGSNYYEFFLDVNESNGGGNNLISLDDIQIYTSATGSQTTSNVSTLGDLRYDLDVSKDSWIKLDYNLGSGSGRGDMRMLLPVSALGGVGPGTFVYLYSQFGLNFGTDDGYEEWAVQEATPTVPLPPAAAAGCAMLALVAGFRAIRRRA
jgi:hypothetical protein